MSIIKDTGKPKQKKKRKTRKDRLSTFRQSSTRTYEMFYDVDRKTIKVRREDFEFYIKGIKAKAFTPFAWDNEKARAYTGLSPDQLMFIKVNFRELAREYNFDMASQEFKSIDKKETK